MVTVEEEASMSAFANFEAPVKAAAAAAPAAPSPPSPAPTKKEVVAVAAMPKAPSPPTTPAPAPTPVVVAMAAAAPVAAATPTAVFSTAWGLGVVDASPLAKTLAREQNHYIATYGSTGQAPILPASA